MILLEEGKDGIISIERNNKMGSSQVTTGIKYLIISDYGSIDIPNEYSNYTLLEIHINNSLRYQIKLDKDPIEFINNKLKSEFRDQKLNSILS